MQPKKHLSCLLVVIFLMAGHSAKCQADSTRQAAAPTMKQYFFVMLTSGTNRSKDTTAAARIQEGHMANIVRLYNMGKILVAGPFGDNGPWRGIFIFDCKTKEEVEGFLKSDPAVAAGSLAYEIHPWWTAMNSVFK